MHRSSSDFKLRLYEWSIPLRFYTLPYWSNPPFLIFDIRALWQYGAGPFEEQQFGTAAIQGVNNQQGASWRGDWGVEPLAPIISGPFNRLTLSPPIPLRLYTLPYWSNPLLLIFDIRPLWRSVLSVRAPECQKFKIMGLIMQYGVEPCERQQLRTAGIEKWTQRALYYKIQIGLKTQQTYVLTPKCQKVSLLYT